MRYSDIANQRAALQQRYRAAIESYHRATTPEQRTEAAEIAAVAISELQHPVFQDLEARFGYRTDSC